MRALHVPPRASSQHPFLVSGGGPGSVSGSEAPEYSVSPSVTGPPHSFAASHPPEGAAFAFAGGFVNNQQFHNAQLAPAPAGIRYYHPGHPEAQPHGGPPSLSHPGAGPESAHQGQAPQGDRAEFQQQQQVNGVPYPGDGSNGGPVPDYGEQSVFAYQDNSIPRLPNGAVMNGPGGFYFKNEPGVRQFQPDPNHVLAAQAAASWGGVGGGFAPGQLALPAMPLQPSYHNYNLQMHSGGQQKLGQRPLCASPLSERAASPDLVDINTVPAIKYQQPHGHTFPMPFSAVDPHGHLQSPMAMSTLSSGQAQLHSAPPHMQRFHSAPGVPTLNGGWNQTETLKSMPQPGFENRNPLRRASAGVQGEEWTLEDNMLSRDASDGEGDSASAKEVNNTNPQVKVEGWATPTGGYTMPVRPGPLRFPSSASTTSTASSLMNVTATPQSLPPIAVFPQANGMQHHPGYPYQTPPPPGWNQPGMKEQTLVTPHMLGRPVFIQHHQADDDNEHQITLSSPPKVPMPRDRQASGVSVVGLGIANVTFVDREGSIEDESKGWTPSESGSLGEDELESDDEANDDDSDDDFVLGAKPKRKSSTGKRSRGTMSGRAPTRGMPKRRVLA